MANWLRDLLVKEISLVDHPANPGAVKVLAKRDDVQKDMYQVSRFAELINSLAYLMQSAEYEAANENDGSQVPAALRTWLRQGATIFTSMAREEVDELLATATKKREFSAKERRRDAKSGAAEGDGSYPIENATDLKNAMRAYGRSKDKAKTKAHIRARARALGLESELSAAFKSDTALEKLLAWLRGDGERATEALSDSVKSIVDDKTATDKGALIDETIKQFSEHVEDELEKTLSGDEPGADSNGADMSPELKKALGLADTATDADAIKAIAARDLDLEIAKAGLTEAEKAHHDGLKTDDERKAFRALSHDERAAKMQKRVDLPEHIVKALAEAEDTKKRLAALEAKDELATFTKRAVEIGLPEAQGELLMKAHKGDKPALKKLEDVIKGLFEQIATGKLFAEFGSAQAADADDPYVQITAKAEELKKANPKLTIEKAKAQVIEDPANRDLVKRYNDQQRAKMGKAA